MKGMIKMTPESLIELTDKCCQYMNGFNKESCKQVESKFSWWKLRNITKVIYYPPFWYGYRHSLHRHMHHLHDIADNAAKTGDEIWLSQLSYTNMVLLSKGDENANPIFIMDY